MEDCKCKIYHVTGCDCPCIEPYAVVVDLIGWLTTRPEVFTASSSHCSSIVCEAMKEYLESRKFNANFDLTKHLDKIKRG